MKKRTMKLTALLFSMALLVLPGTAFSFRQTALDAFRHITSAYGASTYEFPISDDLVDLEVY